MIVIYSNTFSARQPEAAGIYFEGFGMHTFRRLNISWRQEVGATVFEAEKAARHTNPAGTRLCTIRD